MNIKELESKLIGNYGNHKNAHVQKVVIEYLEDAYLPEQNDIIFKSITKNRSKSMGSTSVMPRK